MSEKYKIKYFDNSYFLCYFYSSDEKARPRVQKKQKDSSYLNTFSNKIKQNIDKYRTELTGDENEHGNEDNPTAPTVRRLAFVYYDVKNITSSLWRACLIWFVMWRKTSSLFLGKYVVMVMM